VRGIGTFYYVVYALSRAKFDDVPRVVAIASFVVLASVVLHGVSSTPLMALADRRRAART
jgi:NhaP-type Na+/H+ or K+/H+ antiporter